VLGRTKGDVRFMREHGVRGSALLSEAAQALLQNSAQFAGSVVGSHAERLPLGIRRQLSLEGRASFVPSQTLTARDS
jgi:hypothetical protein